MDHNKLNAAGAKEPLNPSTAEQSTFGVENERSSHRRVDFPWMHVDTRESTQNPISKLWQRKRHSLASKPRNNWVDYLALVLPCVSWIRTYDIKTMLIGDLTAGISVGFMLVAQGLSYATLAGVPAVYGLYGAFLPCMVYALVGTSRQLAVGPVAVTSLLIGTSMKDIVPCAKDITNPNSLKPEQVACQDEYNRTVIQLALIVAVLYTAVGIVRLGWVTSFLSHAVISGFTSGAAITIGLSQFKYVVGYNAKPDKDRLHLFIQAYIDGAREFKWQEFIMGTTLIFLLLAMKEGGKRFRKLRWLRTLGPITACVIGLLTVYIGHVDQAGIRIVGTIPNGLPPWTVGWWSPIDKFGQLLPIAIVVMLVDLLESTSIARALARKNGYELNYNLEIIGLGLANFAGAAFNCYTTTGSFSRSAVNDQAGSQSPLSQFVTAWVIGFVLLFLTPLFSKLPYNVLGAVVVSAVIALFDYEQAVFLWKVNKLDLLVWLASFLGTLFISVEIGLGIAIGLSVLLALKQTAFPHTALLGRVPGANVYRNIKQYPDAAVVPGIVSFRIDAPLYFANVRTVQDRLQKVISRLDTVAKANSVPGVMYVILDLSPVSHMDAMALHFLEDLVLETTKAGQQLMLANPCAKVLRNMEPVQLIELLGRDWVFVSVHDATMYAQARMSEQGLPCTPVVLQYDEISGLPQMTPGATNSSPSSSINGQGGEELIKK